MVNRLLSAGVLGGVALVLWSFVVNGIFGFNSRVELSRVPDERALYSVLKAEIVEPGAYVVNPALGPDRLFPGGEPVFSIRYSGMGHEAAGRLQIMRLMLAFGTALLMAGLLSMSSDRVLSRYWSKVLFVALVALLLALFGDLPKIGIGGYPTQSALLIGANHFLSWVFAGLLIARAMRAPEPEGA